MGQQLVKNYIEQLSFTTINELHQAIDENIMGKRSIINAVRRLNKGKEIHQLTLGLENLFIDNTFWEEDINE